MKNRFYIIAAVVFAVMSISATVKTSAVTHIEGFEPQNLKVLPADIDGEVLKEIMKGFNKALGVKCSHCHALKEGSDKEIDFASDAKHEKLIARGMMMMTQKINEDYFYKYQESEEKVPQVTCMTCHNKQTTPEK